jgi:hypothetical protein
MKGIRVYPQQNGQTTRRTFSHRHERAMPALMWARIIHRRLIIITSAGVQLSGADLGVHTGRAQLPQRRLPRAYDGLSCQRTG